MGAGTYIGPALESLERRQYLAATIVQGELQVLGTHKADSIRLYVDPRNTSLVIVQVNAQVARFPLAAIARVNVQAGQGNDHIRIEGSAPTYAYTTRLYGSGGNDTIHGGTGSDRVYGGTGNDSIDGGFGRDIIYGEWGDDSIWGFHGNDYLSGDSGNDTLIGEQGFDQHFGGEGDDLIESLDDVFDRVDGGPGTDRARSDTVLDQTFVSIETFLL